MVDYRFQKNVLLIEPSAISKDITDIANLIDKIKPESHAIIWQPWEAFDERFEEYLTHDYVVDPNHPINFQYFEDILVQNNVTCYLLVGCDFSQGYSNIKTNPLKNFEVLFWPTALLHYTYYGMVSFYGKEPSELFNPYRPIDKLYLNLNGHERNHRCMLMDYLCKFDLFNYGINTWTNVDNSGWPFKYFTPQKLSYDNFHDKPVHLPQRVFSEVLYKTPNLVDLVGETAPSLRYSENNPELNNYFIFHTEKTFRSILFGKIFLVLGNKGQNLNLEKYGFDLYNDIFDYQFDKSDFFSTRCIGIIDNLYSIKTKNFGEVRDNRIASSRFNIDRATDIVYNDEYIPIQLKTLIRDNKEEYRILLRDFDGNYQGSFGLPDKFSLTEKVFKEIYL